MFASHYWVAATVGADGLLVVHFDIARVLLGHFRSLLCLHPVLGAHIRP